MDPRIIDKVLSRQATPDEARQVANWFTTEEGQTYLSTRIDREAHMMDEECLAEWMKKEIPSDRMKKELYRNIKFHTRKISIQTAVAVLIPLILLLGAFSYITFKAGIFSNGDMAEIYVPYGEQIQVILQDGTKVELNSGSRFEYPKSFGLFSRKVKLNGEGYFTVSKETGRPFYVMLDQLDIKVTGTKFNVKAYSEEEIITVSLEEGAVSLLVPKQSNYPLKVGHTASFNKAGAQCSFQKTADMTVYTAWRTKSLNFYRTPLKEILKILERQHDVSFIVEDTTLLSHKFSLSTDRVNVDDFFSDMEKVSRIRFIRSNGCYIIRCIE